jgi:urease accessory protein
VTVATQFFGPVMALAVFVFLCAQTASPSAESEAVGFLTGFRHPISGLDHVLAMVAVSLWGAQLGSPRFGHCRSRFRW